MIFYCTVNRTAIGESILQKFRVHYFLTLNVTVHFNGSLNCMYICDIQESLLASDDPLPDANPNLTISELENAVKEEISKQFEVSTI